MNVDFLVIGAGVAGLRAAIELAGAGSVLVVAKDTLRESSSEYAQGGIAVALSDDDEVELHEQDTLAAGDGLCNQQAVRVLVEEGPARIQELIDWGAGFDRGEHGRLSFTREGAHSRNRILHAHGDSTGREIARTLYLEASSLPNISFRSYSATTDLLLASGRVTGALLYDAAAGGLTPVYARAVLLATGGLGRVYRETTNPDVATGDGIAMAWRAGAEIADIEFVQFHPTALFVPGAPRFLLSEALRGEGAYLRNQAGDRFMAAYHPMAELAPRDVVSRSIAAELRRTAATHVWLDLTHREPSFIRSRFPRIFQTCLQYGVDISTQQAPVHPAAHYGMGGVRTGLDGRTNVEGLFAAGEVACTGVHGANRLASNSLLEGVVFGARAGAAMREASPAASEGSAPQGAFPDTTEERVRDLAWEDCGLVRTGDGLRRAVEILSSRAAKTVLQPNVPLYELRSMHTVALLIARCALARQESRGGHYRLDFPEKRPEFESHSVVRADGGPVRFIA